MSTVRQAYHRLCDHLGRPGWLSSVGLIENDPQGFVIYLRTRRHPELPGEWEGFPVEVKFFGEFAVMGAVE